MKGLPHESDGVAEVISQSLNEWVPIRKRVDFSPQTFFLRVDIQI